VDPPVDLKVPHILVTYGGHLANWRRRTRIIDYCVDVLDTSYEESKLHLGDEADPGADLRARRKARAELYSSDVKVSGGFLFLSDLMLTPLTFDVQRTQLHNERIVERIVRERSTNGMNLASRGLLPAFL